MQEEVFAMQQQEELSPEDEAVGRFFRFVADEQGGMAYRLTSYIGMLARIGRQEQTIEIVGVAVPDVWIKELILNELLTIAREHGATAQVIAVLEEDVMRTREALVQFQELLG